MRDTDALGLSRMTLKDRFVSRFRPQLEIGSVFSARGHYRVLRKLGQGGMGRVFLAEQTGLHGFSKLVAVKAIPKRGLLPDTRRMFLDEARLTANLIHPNIVQTFQLGETRHELFIVMEHVFGVTLLELIERHQELRRPVPLDQGLFIITHVLSGLHYAHNKHNREGVHLGIVHRDVCPSNIMVSFRGVPKLTDFGVAKAKSSQFHSESEVVFGKYPYMAPEQVGRKGTEPRSDLYSLGLVMYELFTGKLAHEVDDTRMLLKDLDHDPGAPHEMNEDVPADLSAIIMKAISRDKDHRYRNAKTMRVAIETLMLKHFLFPEQDGCAEYLTQLFPQAAEHRWW